MRNFKIGDHVGWNSEAGRVSGTIIRVHTHDFDVKGYTHHASAEAPQYEIKSSKTEHIAFHKSLKARGGHGRLVMSKSPIPGEERRALSRKLNLAVRNLQFPVRAQRWRLATSGTLRLGGRGACGRM